MPIGKQQNASKKGTSFFSLKDELHQLDIETFEIEDMMTLDQVDGALPIESCNTCFTTSCCSSSCSTNSVS